MSHFLQEGPVFYEEMLTTTREMCARFGKVQDVTVDTRGSTGIIYVLYETPQQRMAVESALNGNYTGSSGNEIVASGILATLSGRSCLCRPEHKHIG